MLWEKTPFYWQREVVQSIKCRGANIYGTHGFVKSNFFLLLLFISDFITFSPNLVANHTAISSITPPCYLDPPHTPRAWWPQLGSGDPESDTPSPSRILSPVCRPPPPSLGVTSQLCHSNVSRPNSALGRGGIRDPVPRCVALANQRLRPPPRLFFLV